MTLTLDPTTEQRIQREIERGHYREPAEVIARGVALLEDEEEWLQSNKEAINERLDESYAQVQRGEGIPEDQVRAILAQDRVDRRK